MAAVRESVSTRGVRIWLAMVMVSIGGALVLTLSSCPADAASPASLAPRAVTARGDLAADEKSTIALFERTRDSVVFISTSAVVQDFWSRNVLSVPRGTGSGFIWDEAGHVVTNYHVIEGASEATVKLADGTEYKCSLVSTSPAHDIAVLKIGNPCWHTIYFDRPAMLAIRQFRTRLLQTLEHRAVPP